jgi:hypothetical protein
VTTTEFSSDGLSEEKMICAVGLASGVPGNGITCSCGTAAAEPHVMRKATATSSPRTEPAPVALRYTPTGGV